MTASRTHIVLIPSYNSGAMLLRTVAAAEGVWQPVWVAVDGSTDASADALPDGIRVVRLPRNNGKGAAVRHALVRAERAGFTHALVMDADGQHAAEAIPAFMAASQAQPRALIMGRPEPRWQRGAVRRMTDWMAAPLTAWSPVRHVTFGFRVYPIRSLLEVMAQTRWMRGFDFDAEAAVRLTWRGVKPVLLASPVRHPSRAEGGSRQYRPVSDGALLIWMNLRLLGQVFKGR